MNTRDDRQRFFPGRIVFRVVARATEGGVPKSKKSDELEEDLDPKDEGPDAAHDDEDDEDEGGEDELEDVPATAAGQPTWALPSARWHHGKD